jgi:hypothetical protein
MRWDDLRRQAPRLAAFAHDRLIAPGVLLVVTIRPDGVTRLTPVEPFVWEGELWLSMMWQSRKAIDLLRDDRILVHSITTTRDGSEGEVKVRGRAIAIDDHLFRVEIGNVTVIRYAPSGDQHVARWPSGDEFVRRATSPTSVGVDEEPVVDLFRPTTS